MASDLALQVEVHDNHHGARKEESDHNCPFCQIASTFQPISPLDNLNSAWDPERLSPPTYVLLSTPHVVAFLDIAPLTRGHVLICPRTHRTKIGDLNSEEAANLGRVLPLVSRAVLSATYPDIPAEEADYNVVQNNGPGAAQVIPHVHFHIIPRPPLNYKPPTSAGLVGARRYARAEIPTGLKASYVQFGRGQRHELDDDDAAVLVQRMREQISEEWRREFSAESGLKTTRQQKL